MTSEACAALREKVAKTLYDTDWGDGVWGNPELLSQMERDAYNGLATAAIAVVLEEAARVCDEDAQRSGWLVAAQLGLAEDEKLAFHRSAAKALQLAAAIRGMIPSGNKT
jgi:hypothetical protein